MTSELEREPGLCRNAVIARVEDVHNVHETMQGTLCLPDVVSAARKLGTVRQLSFVDRPGPVPQTQRPHFRGSICGVQRADKLRQRRWVEW